MWGKAYHLRWSLKYKQNFWKLIHCCQVDSPRQNMIKSLSRNLKISRSPRHDEQILALAMRQIEKMLKDMQNEGKDLSGLKLKKFQKTHHIDCHCGMCADAKNKKDPRKRGLLEDGFKVYIEGDGSSWSKRQLSLTASKLTGKTSLSEDSSGSPQQKYYWSLRCRIKLEWEELWDWKSPRGNEANYIIDIIYSIYMYNIKLNV